jgi:hypothetical protein
VARLTSRRDNVPDGDSDARQLAAPLPPISPSELVRLRRGELDADAVALLVGRTVGLAAPAAPPEGDLVPNESGWLVGAGKPPRMQPRKVSKRAEWWSSLAVLPFFVASELLPWPSSLLLLVGPLALVVVGATTFPRARVKRQLKRAGKVASPGDVPEGTLVRVSGTILSQPTVPTLFRGIPAVLFRNRMGPADETRGLDFFLGLDDGGHAKVAVRGGFLLEPPTRTREPPACGPVSPDLEDRGYVLHSDMFRRPPLIPRLLGRYESSVGPGDRVEVCGVVRHELAPELRSLREVPTRAVLEAGEGTPLLVRRLAGG